jgi:hypothetical protein
MARGDVLYKLQPYRAQSQGRNLSSYGSIMPVRRPPHLDSRLTTSKPLLSILSLRFLESSNRAPHFGLLIKRVYNVVLCCSRLIIDRSQGVLASARVEQTTTNTIRKHRSTLWFFIGSSRTFHHAGVVKVKHPRQRLKVSRPTRDNET